MRAKKCIVILIYIIFDVTLGEKYIFYHIFFFY